MFVVVVAAAALVVAVVVVETNLKELAVEVEQQILVLKLSRFILKIHQMYVCYFKRNAKSFLICKLQSCAY